MLCPVPFLQQFIFNDGSYELCCSARRRQNRNYSDWNSEDYQKIRKHMLEEKEYPDVCIECKKNEEAGIKSHAQEYTEWYESLGRPTLDIITGTAIDAPISYDLRMNNICNFSCRMCGPSSSSQIAKEQIKNQALWPIAEYGDYRDNRFTSFDPQSIIENAGSILELRLLGGEPSLQPEACAVLEELVRIKNTNILLFITTNGSSCNTKFWKLVENFSKVVVVVSIDAWGKQHEYIRGPAAHWDTIWNNTQELNKLYTTTIQQTVTTLNIFDFWKLKQNSNIKVRSHACFSPDKYGIRNIPLKWKKRAIEIAKENGVYEKEKHIFQLLMEDGEPGYLKGLKDFTALMDHSRKQYLKDHYPITYEMLEDIG